MLRYGDGIRLERIVSSLLLVRLFDFLVTVSLVGVGLILLPQLAGFRRAPGGDTTMCIRNHRPAVAVTPTERDSAIAGIRQAMESAHGVNPRFDWSRIPDIRPAINHLFVTGNGDVWVEVTTADPGARTWDVYSPDGQYRGTAATSLRVVRWVPPVVRGDRVWAVVTDELDVQYVVAGRLVPAEHHEGQR
jgi:hypothetical protein